jgi:hypothetical protein
MPTAKKYIYFPKYSRENVTTLITSNTHSYQSLRNYLYIENLLLIISLLLEKI